ncbi:hypothetical protein [Pectinatus brassicae]|uniref:Fructose-specific phosphotransferase system component IIB n=1 Tax=Pectinatus brassicae TaxID=862415 RepID=A0A840UJM4_9FIRM|nr:hypothetical protein [Pectinatus brassicae]MBB5337199.1 fructose-specific phosphotransferase system component IIB [Pectinatus brassicae]
MKKVAAVIANPQNGHKIYQAVKALSQAAEHKNIDLRIEIQEEANIYNGLTEAEIAASDIIILTSDSPINNIERFDNNFVLRVITTDIINNPYQILDNNDWQQ